MWWSVTAESAKTKKLLYYFQTVLGSLGKRLGWLLMERLYHPWILSLRCGLLLYILVPLCFEFPCQLSCIILHIIQMSSQATPPIISKSLMSGANKAPTELPWLVTMWLHMVHPSFSVLLYALSLVIRHSFTATAIQKSGMPKKKLQGWHWSIGSLWELTRQ